MNYSILVVDDDPVVRLLLGESLMALGYKVNVVENGKAGLEYLNSDTPDLIFCDLMMPDMNGFDVIKAIRGMEKTKSIPIVMLSANDDRSVMNSAGGNIPDKMLSKPWQTKELIETLTQFLPKN